MQKYTYDRSAPVTWETWQAELAFERTPGTERETQARNSGDARYWYDNYVDAWNNANHLTRYNIDQQHGFFGGVLNEIAPPAPPPAPAAHAPSAPSSPPPAPPASLNPPTPQQISPEPQVTNSLSSSDLTPEANSTTVDVEVVEDSKPIVQADSQSGVTDDNENTDYTVLSQDQETNDDDDSLLTVRDVTPEDEVVDPATGKRYPSPSDARRAGITNWVYAYQYEEDTNG